MANRYWVGGGSSTNWAATGNTNWSATSGGANNASVPGVGDVAIFDGNSGTGNSVISANITVQGVDCTGGTGNYAGTITHNTSVTLTINTGAANSLRFSSGMTYTPASVSAVVAFTNTSGTADVTSAGKRFGALTVNAVGGTVRLLDALRVDLVSTSPLTLTAGTFNANNFDVTAAIVVSTANNTRTLTMGSGAWSIVGTSNSVIWSINNTGTLTFNKNTANITISGSTSSTRTFAGAGLTYNLVTFGTNGGGGALLISGSNTFADLNIAGLSTILVTNGTTTTITNAPTWAGSAAAPICILSQTVGGTISTISVTSGSATLDWGIIRDITVSGGATFTATNTYDLGNNAGWSSISIPAPDASAIATAVWSAATRTLTAIDEDSTTLDLDATIRGAVGLGSANLDTQIGTLATASALSTVAGYVDTEVAAIKAKTDNLPSDPADASDIAAAFGTVNSTLATIAGYIDTEVSAIKATVDSNLDVAVSTRLASAGYTAPANSDIASIKSTVDTNLDATVSSRLATSGYTAPDNASVSAIKAKTDFLTYDVAGQVNANVQSINDVTITGDGSGTPFGV